MDCESTLESSTRPKTPPESIINNFLDLIHSGSHLSMQAFLAPLDQETIDTLMRETPNNENLLLHMAKTYYNQAYTKGYMSSESIDAIVIREAHALFLNKISTPLLIQIAQHPMMSIDTQPVSILIGLIYWGAHPEIIDAVLERLPKDKLEYLLTQIFKGKSILEQINSGEVFFPCHFENIQKARKQAVAAIKKHISPETLAMHALPSSHLPLYATQHSDPLLVTTDRPSDSEEFNDGAKKKGLLKRMLSSPRSPKVNPS